MTNWSQSHRGNSRKNRLSNMTFVTSSRKTGKLYTGTLDRLCIIDYHIDIEQTKGKHQPNRCRKRKNDMKDTHTPQQDLKDALARYNSATNQQATIYKTPGGYWHIVSPDFSFLFNAKTRAELTAQLDAYTQGWIEGRQQLQAFHDANRN